MNSIKTLFRRVLFIYLAITGFVLLNAGMISYAQTGDDLADTNQNTQNVNRTYEFVSSDVYNVTADTGVTAPDTMSVIDNMTVLPLKYQQLIIKIVFQVLL